MNRGTNDFRGENVHTIGRENNALETGGVRRPNDGAHITGVLDAVQREEKTGAGSETILRPADRKLYNRGDSLGRFGFADGRKHIFRKLNHRDRRIRQHRDRFTFAEKDGRNRER